MKKFLILIVIIAVSIFMISSVYAASPQVGKGSNEAFGQITFRNTSSKSDGSSNTSTNKTASVVAGFGRFVTDQVQLGISLMGDLSQSDSGTTSSESKSQLYGADLFAKYHFMSKGQVFVPYLGIQGGYIKMLSGSAGSDSSGTAASYGAMGGVKYFITDNLAANAELNYRHYQMDFNSGSFTSKTTTDDIQALLGFAYFF